MTPPRKRPDTGNPLTQTLTGVRALLTARVEALEARLRGGDETVWPAFLATIDTLIRVMAETTPGAHGELLTTAELGARLGWSEKTVRRRWKRGQLEPVFQDGKALRWRADTRPSGTGNGTAALRPAPGAAGHGPGRAVRGARA